MRNLCSFCVTAEMVKSMTLKLKMNKAPEVDSVGTRVLLDLSEEISYTVAEVLPNPQIRRIIVHKKRDLSQW